MAYYNSVGGLYLASDGATGLPKFNHPLLERDGVTMGLGHYPGFCGPDKTTLPYHVVVDIFQGDWCAATSIFSTRPVRKSSLIRNQTAGWCGASMRRAADMSLRFAHGLDAVENLLGPDLVFH